MTRLRWTDRSNRQMTGYRIEGAEKAMTEIGYTAVMDDDGIPHWPAPGTAIEQLSGD